MKKNYIIPFEEVFAINSKKSMLEGSGGAEAKIATYGFQDVEGKSASALVKGMRNFDDDSSSGNMWDNEW